MENEAFAPALGRIPSGLFILTAKHGEHETGMLASWVQQCSFEPPMVTFAVRNERYLNEWLTADTAITINILEESQSDMIAHFGKGFAIGEDAFSGLEIQRIDGAPAVLANALGYLICKAGNATPTGDHTVYLAEVLDGAILSEGRPYVHVRKNGLHY